MVATVAAISLLGATSLAACTDSQAADSPALDSSSTTTTEHSSDDDAGYLFVFEGNDATLTPMGGDSNAFELSLPIRSPHAPVTWFSDRPVRDAGHMDMASFVALWSDDADDSFKNDPPNVAIAVAGATIIATMTDPRIDSGPDGSGELLLATMTVIPPAATSALADGQGNLAAHAARSAAPDASKVIQADFVSVFVDDYQAVAGGAAPADGTGTLAAGGVAAGAAIEGAIKISQGQ